jgi:eukaryotic-like serine/threonine-protein kinase
VGAASGHRYVRRVERASWELTEGELLTEGRSVLKEIGGGSRYEVYLVWDEELFSIAVAKVLRPDQAEDERALRELAEEAAVLEQVAHPVIVRGFGAVLDGARPHLLIEHLEGPSLRRLLRRGGPLELLQLVPLSLHIAGALAYLELRGLVHLDVKPDNIVMGVPPRLIDLSIARPLERAARSRGPLGTDAYMAPEQCGAPGFGEMGSRADVWGLGATLHHCISGHRPFPRPEGARDSDDPEVRFPQLVREPEPLARSLPAGLGELVGEMLRKNPDERPSAAEVADRLAPLVAEMPAKLSLSRRGRVIG